MSGNGPHSGPHGGPSGWPEGTEAARALAAEVARHAEQATAPPPFAQSRVWARIGAQQQRRARRPMAVALGVAGVTAAVLAVLVARNAMAPATLAGLRLDAESARRVDLRGAAQVALDRGTAAEVSQDDGAGLVVTLERGSLLADVEHRPAGAPFLVRTPRATVRVVGTVLWVSVDEAGEATVLVGRGAVRVEPKEGEAAPGEAPPVTPVAAGERWPASSVRSPSSSQMALLTDRLQGTRFAPPARRTEATRPAPATEPGEAGAELHGDCAALRGAEAVECFARLAGSPDALRAESALFEMGWRQLRDLHDARAALATWKRQRTRFPGGALRTEADTSVVQAAIKLGDQALARAEAEAWLGAHEGGLAAPEIHYHLGAALRAQGDCAAALPHFEAALQGGAGPFVADARRQRDACRRR